MTETASSTSAYDQSYAEFRALNRLYMETAREWIASGDSEQAEAEYQSALRAYDIAHSRWMREIANTIRGANQALEGNQP